MGDEQEQEASERNEYAGGPAMSMVTEQVKWEQPVATKKRRRWVPWVAAGVALFVGMGIGGAAGGAAADQTAKIDRLNSQLSSARHDVSEARADRDRRSKPPRPGRIRRSSKPRTTLQPRSPVR